MSEQLTHLAGIPGFGEAAWTILSPADFKAAWEEIIQWEGYAPTPLHSLGDLARDVDLGQIHYKHEGPRFGLGSFKALGASYAALQLLRRELSQRLGHAIGAADIRLGIYSNEIAQITLASATDGNHGRSLAWGCKKLGAPCRIYIHAEVSEGRARAMQDLGADVVRIDGDYDASVAYCREEAEANGWFVVSDTSWPGYTEPPRDVMAGYGVMLREIKDQLDQPPTHLFVQGGVGGLAAAAAAAARQLWQADAPRIIVVEPSLAPCLIESARQGRATNVVIEQETIMAGLSCGEASPLAWDILASEVSDFVTIRDDLIAPTIRRLARPNGADPAIEAGESGVAGLAALIEAAGSQHLRAKLGLTKTSRCLLIGSEGVTDREIFDRIMQSV